MWPASMVTALNLSGRHGGADSEELLSSISQIDLLNGEVQNICTVLMAAAHMELRTCHANNGIDMISTVRRGRMSTAQEIAACTAWK